MVVGAVAFHHDDGPQHRGRADDHRVRSGGLRVVGHLSPAQSRQGQCGRGGRAAAVRRREPAVAGVPARAVAGQPAGDARGVGIVASRAAPRRDHDPGAPAGSGRPRGRRRGRAARRVARPARRRPLGSARTVRRHHRHPAVAARRHAAAVGPRPAAVASRDGVPGRPGGLAVGAGFRPQLPGDASHGVQVLGRGDQFLRPRLPDAARLRAAALPDPPPGHCPGAVGPVHQPRRLRQHQLVLPHHRPAPGADGHQLVRRGGRPAARRTCIGAVRPPRRGRSPARSAWMARWPASSPWICSRPRSPPRCATTPPRASSRAVR